MSATNDNAPPLPSPVQFSMLLAQFITAREHAIETKAIDDERRSEALRQQLIEAYERAFGGRSQ